MTIRMPGFGANASLVRTTGLTRLHPTGGLPAETEGNSADSLVDAIIPALNWGGVWSHCEGTNRKYAAVLWGIPWGAPWIETCQNTDGPAEVGGIKPHYCEEGWGNVWENWLISRSDCCVCDRWVANDNCPPTYTNLGDCINSGCTRCGPAGGGMYGCCYTTYRCAQVRCGSG